MQQHKQAIEPRATAAKAVNEAADQPIAASPAPPERPPSSAGSYSSENFSDTDYTSVGPGHAQPSSIQTGEAAGRQRKATSPPVPSETELRRSPFIDLEHPVTLREAVKLAVMAPVVLLKVSMCSAFEQLPLLLHPLHPIWPSITRCFPSQ
jgi:hypothetical protein